MVVLASGSGNSGRMQRSKSTISNPGSPNKDRPSPQMQQQRSSSLPMGTGSLLPAIKGNSRKINPARGGTLPEQDISPSLAMHMRRSTSEGFGMSPSHRNGQPPLRARSLTGGAYLLAEEQDDEHPPSEETQNWMSNVMAGMTKKRKSLLTPMEGAPTEAAVALDEGPKAILEKAGITAPSEDGDTGTAQAEDKSVEKVNNANCPNQIPDPESVLRRFGGGQGFDSGELTRMRATFNRFKVPDTVDVHKDDLTEILSRLGYMMVEEEDVRKIADEATIYSTLDFNEFVGVVEKFSAFEIGQFKVMFDSYDDDGSGSLSTCETQKLMSSLGFTPLKSMIKEALEVVDKDKSGQMEFGEFIHLQAIYRCTEGFTRKEVGILEAIFKGECEEGANSLCATKLRDVLLHFNGPQSHEVCNQLGKEVLVSSRKDHDPASEVESAKPMMLNFPEVMIWARRLREYEFETYSVEFKKQDKDGSGFIDMQEIQSLVADLGFTLSKKIVQQFIDMVDDDWVAPDEDKDGDGKADVKEKDNKLDFDEFVNLMLLLRDTDGFTRADLAEFKKTFLRFDDDTSGDVDVLELSDMMRYLGHQSSLDEVHRLIAKVDFNDSGSLDFREFVRLLRVHREVEVQEMRKAFDKRKEPSGLLPASSVKGALEDCNVAIPDAGKKGSGTEFKMPSGDMDFDPFVEMVDGLRAIRVAEGRRRAGFSNAEIERFRKMFSDYDADKSGSIDAGEVANLLVDLGFKLRTKEERDNVLAQVDKAREAAAMVGVTDVGEKNRGTVGFWVLVQLLRVLYNRDDKRLLDRESHAAEQSRFSTHEIEEFREVFLNWWSHEKNFEDEEEENRPGQHDKAEPEVEPDCKEISKDGMRRLLRQLGCNLNHDQRVEMENKISELDQINHHGIAHVDFASFLRLMRWMLDSNFADINKHTAKTQH